MLNMTFTHFHAFSGQAVLRENNAVQHAAGASWIRLMDPGELNTRRRCIRSSGDIARITGTIGGMIQMIFGDRIV